MSRFHKLNFTHGLVRRRHLFNLIKRTVIIIILIGLTIACRYFYLTPEERDCVFYEKFGKIYPNMYIKNEVLKAVMPAVVDSRVMFERKVTPSVVLDLFSGVSDFVFKLDKQENAGFSNIRVESIGSDGWCVSLSQFGKDSSEDLLLALNCLTNSLVNHNVIVDKVVTEDSKVDVSGQFPKFSFSDLDIKIDDKTTFLDLYTGKIKVSKTDKIKNPKKKSDTDKSYDKWITETKEHVVNSEVGMIYEELQELINDVDVQHENSQKKLQGALLEIAARVKQLSATANSTNLAYEATFIVNPSDYISRLTKCSEKAGLNDHTRQLEKLDKEWDHYANSFLNLHPSSHDKLKQLNVHLEQISLPSNETFVQLYAATYNLLESYTNLFSGVDIERGYKNMFYGVSDCMEFSSGKAKKLNDLFSTIDWKISTIDKFPLNGRLDNYNFLKSLVNLCKEPERYQITTFGINYERYGKEIRIKSFKLGGYVPVLNRENLVERIKQLRGIRQANEILKHK